MAKHLLKDALPQFRQELETMLLAKGENELAAQTETLGMFDRCRCGDGFCATFYTLPKPNGAYGPDHYCLDLDATRGMIILDVVAGKIACVEVLNRNEIRRRLLELFP
jgi:hypothetical protein